MVYVWPVTILVRILEQTKHGSTKNNMKFWETDTVCCSQWLIVSEGLKYLSYYHIQYTVDHYLTHWQIHWFLFCCFGYYNPLQMASILSFFFQLLNQAIFNYALLLNPQHILKFYKEIKRVTCSLNYRYLRAVVDFCQYLLLLEIKQQLHFEMAMLVFNDHSWQLYVSLQWLLLAII